MSDTLPAKRKLLSMLKDRRYGFAKYIDIRARKAQLGEEVVGWITRVELHAIDRDGVFRLMQVSIAIPLEDLDIRAEGQLYGIDSQIDALETEIAELEGDQT